MSKPRVLVIDDEQAVLKFFHELNNKMGMDVKTASKNDDANKLWDSEDFTMAFIDLEMPEKDGLILYKELSLKKPDVPIYMLSYKISDPRLDECLLAGARGIIFKPPDLDETASVIQQNVVIKYFKSEIDHALEKSTEELSEMIREVELLDKKVGS
jgi:DNA-binding NtrC family response regulator